MLLTFLLACSPPPPPAPRPQATAETVVLVIACTARADRFSAWGHERPTSPYLRALAEGGTRFASTLSNAGWTRPAVASLITGLHPYVTGVDPADPGAAFAAGLAPEASTLAERFQEAGFHTVGLTANPNVNARLGMAQGFDRYVDTEEWRQVRSKQPGTALVRRFAELAAELEGPLFAQLVLVDAHAPLAAEHARRARLGISPLGTGSLADRYDAALTRLDEAVAALDEALSRLGREDRLLVVIGDHGEGLNRPKHAGRGHSHHLYDANLSVPWLLHGAGVPPGRVVEGRAQSVDLAPTLTGLVGLPPAPSDGVDLGPWIREEKPLPSRSHLAMTRYRDADRTRWSTEEWVLVRAFADGGQPGRGPLELYAATDRQQRQEVARDHPEVASRLLAELLAAQAALEARALAWQGEVDEATRGQLEALGYVE